ncbi:uncharacterized protein LOC117317073 [Pecten maximus]|uniref:uncharacterized protein LOC117317073 n=1 Tax=Pecten maximus TaxID=6579 RepID=UPI001458DD21|nr:uncharacterized protein LOC117317073 [Pecten maximus]
MRTNAVLFPTTFVVYITPHKLPGHIVTAMATAVRVGLVLLLALILSSSAKSADNENGMTFDTVDLTYRVNDLELKQSAFPIFQPGSFSKQELTDHAKRTLSKKPSSKRKNMF